MISNKTPRECDKVPPSGRPREWPGLGKTPRWAESGGKALSLQRGTGERPEGPGSKDTGERLEGPDRKEPGQKIEPGRRKGRTRPPGLTMEQGKTKMHHEICIRDLQDLGRAAEAFLREIGAHRLIAFHAPMGAGKTTFTTAVCKALGVREDAISSPTFAIVNEYRAGDGAPVYHFDFYRIEKEAEALDIGLYDYLDSGCLCLMEWPENIAGLLPEETLVVSIRVNPDGSRSLLWDDQF